MRCSLFASLIAAVVLLAHPVAAQVGGQELTDEEMDQIVAGDICSDFGISGSCAISYVDVFDPGQTTIYETTPLPATFSSTTTTTTSGGSTVIQTINSDTSTSQSNTINSSWTSSSWSWSW